MATPETIPLNAQLCFTLYGTSLAINRTYKPLLDQLGLTYPQYLVLSTLWEGDDQTIGAIAARLDLEPSTITPLVKRLEQAAFVRRERNPADERQVRVRLTKAGVDMQARTVCLSQALLERSGLTVDEIVDLNARVQRVRDALGSRL